MTRALRMQAPINLPVDQCNVEDGGKGGKINKIIKKKKTFTYHSLLWIIVRSQGL